MGVDISPIHNCKEGVLPFHFEQMGENFTESLSTFEFPNPIIVEGTVLCTQDGYYTVKASASTLAVSHCDRCIVTVPIPLQTSFTENYRQKEFPALNDTESEEFSGDQIDILSAAEKSLLCQVPMKVLCKEECKGLCPVCGINKNTGSCSCEISEGNLELQKLRELLHLDEEV